ncbi:hypothetical protein CFP65_3466 [Kitasatospora sp. MMS16-BH015]|uniref:hypothetical protein n=1 Tax=Kitasatospora sp. MMS16-BH015 TaxID=2018025 RepID=UPI000CA12E81|nr:hypothetical protein [Kitasatospora sp. MMS16-BH015]AUG78259.1 hypothetical protein CFP65_3466 [Kitasatospora sp. MMS16-BH015]
MTTVAATATAGAAATAAAEDLFGEVTAGPYTDPLTGEQQVLIQQAEPSLLADPARLDLVRAALHAECPETASTLLRAPAGVELPAPWRRRLSYLRCTDPTGLPDLEHPFEVAPATAEDDPLVRAWLARALLRGAADTGHAAPEATADGIAEAILGRPGRLSLVVRRAGRTVGHATLLVGQADETSGEQLTEPPAESVTESVTEPLAERVTELVDILIEETEDVRLATAVLSRAAAVHAHTLGQPLLGNVVHSHDQDPATGGRDTWRIVTALTARGWHLAHEFWWAPAPAPAPAPGPTPAAAP